MDKEKKESNIEKQKENKEEEEKGNALAKCQKERDEYLSGWQRAKADFVNYKREEEERIAKTVRLTQEILLRELVAILDSFDLGLVSWNDESPEKKGMTLVKMKLADILKKYGLKEIKTGVGEEFDPKVHEALQAVESDNPSGTIVMEMEKGYLFHDKVIRPARVKVAK